MATETGGLPFIDPREFLSRPFHHYESARMYSAPTLELLQWVPTLPDEAGFVLRGGVWVLIKGDKEGIPGYSVPPDSDVFIHSHPIEEDEEKHPSFLPSPRDFLNAWTGIRNFITSTHGLTRYQPVTGVQARRELEAEIIYRWRPRMAHASGEELLAYYNNELGAQFDLIRWGDIDEAKFSVLLKP